MTADAFLKNSRSTAAKRRRNDVHPVPAARQATPGYLPDWFFCSVRDYATRMTDAERAALGAKAKAYYTAHYRRAELLKRLEEFTVKGV